MKRLGAKPKPKSRLKTPQPPDASDKITMGSTFIGQVRDLNADGNGVVAHPSGQIFFVPGVWLDEQVEVTPVGFKNRLGFAELVQVIVASPFRVTAPCPYQGFSTKSCGGCPWQFVDYDAQLQAKQARVEQAFEPSLRNKSLKPGGLQRILPSPEIFNYRNRTQLKTDGVHLGYIAAGSRNLVNVEDCLILTEKNRATLQSLRHHLPKPDWRPRQKNRLTTIDIDESVDAEQASINQRLPFRQANSWQNSAMQTWLHNKLAQLDSSKPVIELFAGSGNFTGVAVDAGFTNILAVEVVDEAMHRLRERYPEVKTLACDLFAADAADRLFRAMPEAEILLLDPPRDGLKNETLKSVQGLFRKKSRIQDVLYISCNLATLVRDLQAFTDHGFKIKDVQPVDQFPHTPHIELMVHLQKC